MFLTAKDLPAYGKAFAWALVFALRFLAFSFGALMLSLAYSNFRG